MEAQHRSKRRKTSRKEEGLLQKMKGFVGEKADLSLLRYFLAKASNDYIDAIQLYYTAKEEDNEAGCILEESDREAHEEILKKSVLNGVGVHPGMQIRVEWNLRDERKGCDADVKVVDGRIITVSYKGSYKGKEQTIDLDGTEFDITLLPAQTERPLQPVKTIILRDFKRLQNPEEYSQKLSVKSRSAKKSTPKRKKTRKSATTSSSARKHWFSTGVTSRKGNGENAENTNPLGLALKNVAQSQKPTSSHDENPQHSSKLLRQDGKVDTSRSPLLSVLTTASEQNTQALSETIVMSPPEGKVFKKPRGIRNGTKKQASSRRCGKRCKGATAFTNGEGITTTTMSPAVNQNRRKMGKKSKRAVAAGVGGGASSSSSSPLMLSKVANLKSSCPSAGSTSRRRGGKTTTTSSSSSSSSSSSLSLSSRPKRVAPGEEDKQGRKTTMPTKAPKASSDDGTQDDSPDPDVVRSLIIWKNSESSDGLKGEERGDGGCSILQKRRAMKFIQTVMVNIVKHPRTRRYRKLRVPYVMKKFEGIAGALDLLLSIGFVEDRTHFVMSPVVSGKAIAALLRKIRKWLRQNGDTAAGDADGDDTDDAAGEEKKKKGRPKNQREISDENKPVESGATSSGNSNGNEDPHTVPPPRMSLNTYLKLLVKKKEERAGASACTDQNGDHAASMVHSIVTARSAVSSCSQATVGASQEQVLEALECLEREGQINATVFNHDTRRPLSILWTVVATKREVGGRGGSCNQLENAQDDNEAEGSSSLAVENSKSSQMSCSQTDRTRRNKERALAIRAARMNRENHRRRPRSSSYCSKEKKKKKSQTILRGARARRSLRRSSQRRRVMEAGGEEDVTPLTPFSRMANIIDFKLARLKDSLGDAKLPPLEEVEHVAANLLLRMCIYVPFLHPLSLSLSLSLSPCVCVCVCVYGVRVCWRCLLL